MLVNDYAVARVDVVAAPEGGLAEALEPVGEKLPEPVRSVEHRAVRMDPGADEIGMRVRQRAVQVAPLEGLERLADELDVLLRHRRSQYHGGRALLRLAVSAVRLCAWAIPKASATR